MGEPQKYTGWTHVQSWHRYPYAIQYVHHDGWHLIWHHDNAGCSHTLRKGEPSELMAFAEEVHGPANGWLPYSRELTNPRNTEEDHV